jgi:peptidoglycan-associated lipoprotein
MLTKTRLGAIFLSAALALIAGGCGKKATPYKAPTVTPTVSNPGTTNPNDGSNKPTVVSFVAEPQTVERGQSAQLRWSITNATSITIDNGIGEVTSTGTRRITPSESTTYRLSASGPNGAVSATTTVNVTSPAPPTKPVSKITQTLPDAVNTMLADAFFDYDSNQIRDDARGVLTRDADALKKIFTDFPNATVIVEGHCDERGSAEYNLGLADQRASSTKEFLVSIGVPAARLKTVSYGKERPQCTEQTEECFQRNRRAHFAAAQ